MLTAQQKRALRRRAIIRTDRASGAITGAFERAERALRRWAWLGVTPLGPGDGRADDKEGGATTGSSSDEYESVAAGDDGPGAEGAQPPGAAPPGAPAYAELLSRFGATPTTPLRR
jgi:hypothetical protein